MRLSSFRCGWYCESFNDCCASFAFESSTDVWWVCNYCHLSTVLDELDAWKPEGMTPVEAFALVEQRIRSGENPQLIVTSTPKRGGLIKNLRERDDTVVTRATMYDNAPNLSPKYVRRMIPPDVVLE